MAGEFDSFVKGQNGGGSFENFISQTRSSASNGTGSTPSIGTQMSASANATALQSMKEYNPYLFENNQEGFGESALNGAKNFIKGVFSLPGAPAPTATLNSLQDVPAAPVSKAIEQTVSGNPLGAAGTVAGNVAPIVGAAALLEGAKATPGALGAVGDAASAVMDHPATGPLVKVAGKIAANHFGLRTAMDLANTGREVYSALTKDAPKPSGPGVSTPVTTSTEISPKVTVESSTNAFGTSPIKLTESTGKGARTMDNLNEETVQKLVDLTKSGEIKKLDVSAQKDLIAAVKTGDSEVVNAVLADKLPSSVDLHMQNQVAKAQTIANYIKAHSVDLSDLDPANKDHMQTLADAAVAHAKQSGMNVYRIPVSGKYRGISPDTWVMVNKIVLGK